MVTGESNMVWCHYISEAFNIQFDISFYINLIENHVDV